MQLGFSKTSNANIFLCFFLSHLFISFCSAISLDDYVASHGIHFYIVSATRVVLVDGEPIKEEYEDICRKRNEDLKSEKSDITRRKRIWKN